MFQKVLRTIKRDLEAFGPVTVHHDETEVRCCMPSSKHVVARNELDLPSIERKRWRYYVYNKGIDPSVLGGWGQQTSSFHQAVDWAMREFGGVDTRIGHIQGRFFADCWYHRGTWDVSFSFGYWSAGLSPALSNAALPFGRAITRGGDPGPTIDWLQEEMPSFHQLVEQAHNEPSKVQGVYVSRPAMMWPQNEDHRYFTYTEDAIADAKRRAAAEGRRYEVAENLENKLEFEVWPDGNGGAVSK